MGHGHLTRGGKAQLLFSESSEKTTWHRRAAGPGPVLAPVSKDR